MTRQTRLTALILAGGLSRRMGGEEKAFCRIGGERLVDLVVAKAKSQFDHVAINVFAADRQAETAFSGFGLPLVADGLPGHAGPLAGVLAGMDFFAARLGGGHMATLPCDCPFLPHDLAARFAQAAQEKPEGLFCAASGGRLHPVVALWPLALRAKLRRALIDEDLRKVGAFQRQNGCAAVEWPAGPPDPFFNVNTPDDLAAAQAMAAGFSTMKLDLRGLKCPLPALKTRKCLAAMAPGERVEVACTDPMAAIDLPNLLRETGDVLERRDATEGALLFLIRKG